MRSRPETLLRAAVVMCVMALIAACAAPGSSTSPTGGPATAGPATPGPTTAPATETPPDQVTGELLVLDWTGYDAADFWIDFKNKYANATATFEFGGSDADIYGKMKAGSQADVFHPYTGWLQFYVDEGMVEEIDTTKLKNWDKVPDSFKALGQFNGKQYFIPWDWGFSSILYRTDHIATVDSWSVLLDPKYKGHLSMWDDGPGAVTVSSYIHDYDETSITDAQLAAIKAEWTAQAPLNKTYWAAETDLIPLVQSDEVWAAYAWQGAYATLLGQGVPVAYANPKEGRNSWVGVYGIRKGTPNLDLALRFLDEKLADATSTNLPALYYYGSANSDVMGAITDASLKAAFGIDDPSILKTTNFTPNLTAEQRDAWTAMWTEVKAAQ
ncbi:MAG: extracellular solute-binding protein [Candidatus Limnocylindrales bacterium]